MGVSAAFPSSEDNLRRAAKHKANIVALLLQASARSARRRALGQAARLRSGRGLQSGRSLRAIDAAGTFPGGMVDVVASSSTSSRGGTRPTSRALPPDPFALERARAIEDKASQPLLAGPVRLAAWAPSRRRARERLSGLLAAFGQYQDLGGLRRSVEPFCVRRLMCGLSL